MITRRMTRAPRLTHTRTPTLLLGAFLMLSACEHPIGVVTPHIEAADLVIADSAGAHITRTEFNRRWRVDSLVLHENTPLRITLTPVDFRGLPIDLSDRNDLSYRLEAENGALLQWEPQRGFGWLRPFAAGETRVRFLFWHDTHVDFATPWLRVLIRDYAAQAAHP
jgi:hypothetical protein